MSQLKRDTQMTLLSRIPVMLLSFLAVVLLTRLLGPEGNGVYTFIYAGLNLCMTILGFQLDGSLTFFLSNKSQEQITEDYKHLSGEVSALMAQIKQIV